MFALDHAGQERATCSSPILELRSGVERWTDLAGKGQPRRGRALCRAPPASTHLLRPEGQYRYLRCRRPSLRNRRSEQSAIPSASGARGLPDWLHHGDGLAHHCAKLIEDGAVGGWPGSASVCRCASQVTRPLDTSRLSSRCTAPEPEPVTSINSLAKKLRDGLAIQQRPEPAAAGSG